MAEVRFEALVREHHRAVSTYARSMASTPTIAEDAVQETFIRAWKYLDSFRGTGSFEGWLIRICRRCVFDLESRAARDEVVETAPEWLTQEPDQTGDTFALIAALPREQREVVIVCGVLGYEYQDAAVILDIPIGTVRSRLHRARGALHDAMASSTTAGEATA